MAIRQYTRSELIHLRDSPLVERPENLPSIEQWIEYVYVDKDSREKLRIPHSESQTSHPTSNRRQAHSKGGGAGGDASPMGNFGASVRPSLVTRTTGGKSGEDISLGPPRTMFPSSRNTAKLADSAEKPEKSSAEIKEGDEQEAPRSRFFGEKANRKSTNEREGRDNRESWTSARERRAQGGDDESRESGKYSRRDKGEDGERRNGFGEKHDSRWGEKRQNGERQGGWRAREREKDWDKGGIAEKEPEWMDDPAPPSAEDDLRTMGMPRNQEQFQKWKDAMSGKKAQSEEPENAQAEPVTATKETAPPKSIEPLKLEGVVDKPFGGWGDGKSTTGAIDSSSTTAKSAPGKGRASRFASMFKETQPKEETPPAENTTPQPSNVGANGSAEDEAGFKRILQMLGGTGIGQPTALEGPSSPPHRTTSNGTKQKSRFTGFFDQTPKSPERMQSPPEDIFNKPANGDMFQGTRGMGEEPGSMFGGRLPDTQPSEQVSKNQAPNNMMSPEPPMNGNREHQGPPGRVNDIFLEQQPPSRGAATPDVNIQNLLASQRAQKPQGQDKNSEFLLNLLQTKGGSRPTSQQARGDNFSLWLDQPPNMPEPHAPKPRGAQPPPGFIDDQLLRNAPPDPPRPDQSMLERRTSQRAPPGFFDEQSLFSQPQQQPQQRRAFTEQPQQYPQYPQQGPLPGRRMSGQPQQHLQHMQIPQPQFPGGPPPEFMQSPLSGQGPPGPQAPPPGFNPHMARHPPGFHNIPNIFQQPQGPQGPQQHQQRNDLPSGYPGGMQGGGIGNGGMASPPNAPPGFFGGPGGPPTMPGVPPPGFMGMRSPNEGVPAGMRGGGRGYDGSGYDGSGLGGSRR